MSNACHRLPSFLEMLQNHHACLTFDKVHNPVRLPRETESERPKVARTCCVYNILTSKCASRHNGVHFFDIATSKSGPELVCFIYVVLRATMACTFLDISTSKSGPKVVLLAFSFTYVLCATTA